MPRSIDPVVLAGLAAAVLRPFLLVELDYESGPVRLASTPFNIIHEGNSYLGVGRLGAISAVPEGTEIRSYGVTLRLSGIPLELVAQAQAERYQDRSAKVWLGLLDEGHRVLGPAVQIFGGRMDVSDFEIGETLTIILTAESRLVDWERPRIRRYTDQDQKRAWPGDRGLEYVQAVTDMEIVWGRA